MPTGSVLNLLIACLAAIAFVAGEANAREPGWKKRYEQWKRADADGDGRLSRLEARDLPSLYRKFDALDGDRDGFITPEEVRAARSHGAVRRRTAPGVGPLFDRADKNGDGVLSGEEARASLPRMAARFNEIDGDQDGRVSREEMETWLAGRRALRSIAR